MHSRVNLTGNSGVLHSSNSHGSPKEQGINTRQNPRPTEEITFGLPTVVLCCTVLLSGRHQTAQTSPNVQLPGAGRQATVYYKRGSHLPDMRFTRPWFSWTALMSHNSLVDDSVISATTMDLIVGLALGSSCVHALASIVNCKMRTMR